MKHGLAHKLVLIFIVVALLCALFACSPREQDDVNDPHNDIVLGEDSIVEEEARLEESVSGQQAQSLIKEVAANYNTKYVEGRPDNPEWFVIDLEFKYSFDHFWLDCYEKYDKASNFSVIFKANVHLKDNNKSELYFQVRNANNYPVLCVYYATGYTYFVVGTQKYYMAELNFSQVGGALYNLLFGSEMPIDVLKILSGVIGGGKTGIDALDGLLPVVSTFLFDNKAGYVTDYDKDPTTGEFMSRDIGVVLKHKTLLNQLTGTGIPIQLNLG
ncbi:MAG: hypothetical protein J6R35_01195, partial [Clostridia bacterium]|nr:hypothetical protein [Clostridia bacterium]